MLNTLFTPCPCQNVNPKRAMQQMQATDDETPNAKRAKKKTDATTIATP